MSPYLLFEKSVKEALLEDLGRAGDITSEAIFSKNIQIEATLVARKSGILCGTSIALTAFKLVDPEIRYENLLKDKIGRAHV